MSRSRYVASGVSAFILLAATEAGAQSLTIVEVGAPAVNCVFNAACTVTVNDSSGPIGLPLIATPGSAWLQSRTFQGAAGTPAAGKTAYVYRVSLTQASGQGCVSGVVLNFGPHTPLPYKPGQTADVYVVTTGGLGSVGLAAATRFGDVIVFDFKKPVCVEGPASPQNTSYFFGLAANAAPIAAKATVFGPASPPAYQVNARVPAHAIAPSPDE